MSPSLSANRTFSGANAWNPNVVVAIPPQDRGLQVAGVMIPGHDILTQPGLQRLGINEGGGADTQEHAEMVAIPRPGTALPVIGVTNAVSMSSCLAM